MKHLIFAFLLCMICGGSISSETVMLYLANSEDSIFIREETVPLAMAIEDGIMEVFFDTGHIIFNSGIDSEEPPDPPFKSERIAVRLAKAGGALYLLEVELFAADAADSMPSFATFIFTDLQLSEVISKGRIVTEELIPDSLTDPGEVCVLLGRDLAQNALQEW